MASKLIDDLSKVPNIIGNLGLSVAAAQKAFNLDYLEGLERVVALARSLVPEGAAPPPGGAGDVRAVLVELVKAMAPARYQFTETTLAVRLDLAQTMSASASVGLGVGYAGVSVNAALTVGYRYDYRAAAECRTVIHAVPMDASTLGTLLNRAAEVHAKALDLPALSEVDRAIVQQANTVFEKITGAAPADPIKEKGVAIPPKP